MPRRIYSKPIASFEYGTRVYAPSESRPTYRVIAKDPDGKRIFLRFPTEDEAREHGPRDRGLARLSVTLPGGRRRPDHRRPAHRPLPRQPRVPVDPLRRASGVPAPLLGPPGARRPPARAWTPADSDQVLDRRAPRWRRRRCRTSAPRCGRSSRSPSRTGGSPRGGPDVDGQYSPSPSIKARRPASSPATSLPTDEQCAAPVRCAGPARAIRDWALAMRLKHRSGLRWGELIALRPCDLDLRSRSAVVARRAGRSSSRRQGFAIKTTKNRQRRQTIFPASLCDDLASLGDQREPLRRAAVHRHRRRVRQPPDVPALSGPEPPRPPAGRCRDPCRSIWHPHDLRHVAACWMLFDVGLDPRRGQRHARPRQHRLHPQPLRQRPRRPRRHRHRSHRRVVTKAGRPLTRSRRPKIRDASPPRQWCGSLWGQPRASGVPQSRARSDRSRMAVGSTSSGGRSVARLDPGTGRLLTSPARRRTSLCSRNPAGCAVAASTPSSNESVSSAVHPAIADASSVVSCMGTLASRPRQ